MTETITDEEILECSCGRKGRWIIACRSCCEENHFPTPKQLWLSKEDYEKRVEKFKKELEEIYKACNDKRVYEIQVMIGNLGLKINKILLGKK